MTLVLLVIVGALLLAASPGLALIAAALAFLALDRLDPHLADRLLGHHRQR